MLDTAFSLLATGRRPPRRLLLLKHPSRLLMSNRQSILALAAAWLLAPSSAAFAQLPSGTWQYQWGDEFGSTSLDQTKWSYNYPWGATHKPDATMSPDNVEFGDGALTLVAERTGSGGEFTSGAISSGYTKANFSSGFIEASIKMPDTRGSWPAFWMLRSGWPPEIDIMEYPLFTNNGDLDTYSANSFWGSGSSNFKWIDTNVNLAVDYHQYALEWDNSGLRYYFDGNLVHTASDQPDFYDMYLILNYAVGDWPGRPSTSQWPVGHSDEMKVDWVRVWKKASASGTNWDYAGADSYVQWDTASNWTNGAPNLGGVTAWFDTVTPSEQRIDWSGRRTMTVINIDGDTRYRFGYADDRLVLGYGNNGTMRAAINVAATTTTEHEVLAGLEFAGRLELKNNSAHPLLLTGPITGGGGDVRVDGPGVVSFDGGNSYSSNTYVGIGEGPGVARARGQNAFGIGGALIIGDAGNSTTARVELQDGALVSNRVTLPGRHAPTPAVVNTSGDNTLSGRVTVNYGGAYYGLHSADGSLTLSGGTRQAAGVAISTLPDMGEREIVLSGAGDIRIEGAIENASGTTLSFTKTGAGTWSLGGDNTYAGATTVSEGTLEVDGATGYGPTTLAAGTTLAGGGLVRGNLTAAAGAVVRVGSSGLSIPVGATLIDNFDTYNNTFIQNVGAHSNGDATAGVWDGVFDGTSNALVVDNLATDNALAVFGVPAQDANGWRGAKTNLAENFTTDMSLWDGFSATYFFQVMNEGNAYADTMVGLSESPASVNNYNAWQDYAVMPYVKGNPGAAELWANGAVMTPLVDGQWQNVWLVVDNDAKTFDLYTSTGEDPGVLAMADLPFSQLANPQDLAAFAITGREDGRVRVDNLYRTVGVDTSNPLLPPALTGETLSVGGDLTLAGATIQVDLGADTHDALVVTGVASLDGQLHISLQDGYNPLPGETFTVLTASGVSGNLALGGADAGRFSLHASTPSEVVLTALSGMAGDFNNDGAVDVVDYAVWRESVGQPGGHLLNDASGVAIGQTQMEAWLANYGAVYVPPTGDGGDPGGGGPGFAPHQTPSPAAALLLLAGLAIAGAAPRWRAC